MLNREDDSFFYRTDEKERKKENRKQAKCSFITQNNETSETWNQRINQAELTRSRRERVETELLRSGEMSVFYGGQEVLEKKFPL